MLYRLIILFLVGTISCMVACTPTAVQSSEPRDVNLGAAWSGDYPVAALGELPAKQRQNRVGYISDAATLAGVWRHFMPGQALPAVDFDKELVVFSRNLEYYNRTRVFKVTLAAGVAEIIAMETMSAIPVDDKVAMALAVIPRSGIKAVRLDAETVLAVD
jgi:hypothetical protein